MSDLPGWAVVGAKVVALETYGDDWRGYVAARGVYTIRTVILCPVRKKWGFNLSEIRGRINPYVGGEYSFPIRIFRPLVTEEHDLETHFRIHLKNDHRAPETVA